jgi:RuvB-like protein 2
MEPKID